MTNVKAARPLMFTIGVLIAGLPTANAQILDLKIQDFTASGIVLPDDIHSIGEWNKFQGSFKYHDTVDVKWDSLNGKTALITRKEAKTYQGAISTFVVIEHLTSQIGSPDILDIGLGRDRLVVVGRNAADEVHCMVTASDTRQIRAEDFRKDKPETIELVSPRAQLHFQFCDDSSITKLEFWNDGGVAGIRKLHLLGSTTLGKKELPMKHLATGSIGSVH